MCGDAKEVLNVTRNLALEMEENSIREVSVAFFQTHMNAESTEVRIKIKR
jgi:hypothetical protein